MSNKKSEWNPEQRLAASIAKHRAAAGYTYEALAFRMKQRGVNIHPSAIQKTEKSGRKASIDEMVAYANIFNVPVEDLWGGVGRDVLTLMSWKDIHAAVSLLEIMDQVQDRFDWLIRNIRLEMQGNPDLRGQVEEWLAENLASKRAELHTKYDSAAEVASDAFIDQCLKDRPTAEIETARMVLADDVEKKEATEVSSDGK